MPRDGMKKAKGSSAKSKSLAGAGAGKKRSASSKARCLLRGLRGTRRERSAHGT